MINIGHESKNRNLASSWNPDAALRYSTVASVRESYIHRSKIANEVPSYCFSPHQALNQSMVP